MKNSIKVLILLPTVFNPLQVAVSPSAVPSAPINSIPSVSAMPPALEPAILAIPALVFTRCMCFDSHDIAAEAPHAVLARADLPLLSEDAPAQVSPAAKASYEAVRASLRANDLDDTFDGREQNLSRRKRDE
jgi:hypothetical protein